MLTLRKTPKAVLSLLLTRPLTTTQLPDVDPPSSVKYDQLINAAGRSHDFPAVAHLLECRHRDGFFNTNDTFKFISSDLSIIPSLLHTLSSHLPNKSFVKKHSFDSLISRLSKLHQPHLALQLIVPQILHSNAGLNPTSFHPILASFTKRQMPSQAWNVIDRMKQLRVSPDITAYNYVLTMYCFTGELGKAAEVVEMIEGEGMEADSRTYDALVLGCCKVGRVEGAMAVMRRMVEEGVTFLYCSHIHVISALLKMRFYGKAVEFVVMFGGRDVAFDTETFGVLASKLIGLKRFREARLVLEEMKVRGLRMGEKLRKFDELGV